MLTLTMYRDAITKHKLTNNDSELYAISDAIDKMSYADRIYFRECLVELHLPILPNLTYDYDKQCWITKPNGKLFEGSI